MDALVHERLKKMDRARGGGGKPAPTRDARPDAGGGPMSRSQRIAKERAGEAGLSNERRFELALEKDRIKLAVLDEAAIVCSTLSFSGSGMFSRMTKQFDVVVIDEAAQAVEPSTLVPLCYGKGRRLRKEVVETYQG